MCTAAIPKRRFRRTLTTISCILVAAAMSFGLNGMLTLGPGPDGTAHAAPGGHGKGGGKGGGRGAETGKKGGDHSTAKGNSHGGKSGDRSRGMRGGHEAKKGGDHGAKSGDRSRGMRGGTHSGKKGGHHGGKKSAHYGGKKGAHHGGKRGGKKGDNGMNGDNGDNGNNDVRAPAVGASGNIGQTQGALRCEPSLPLPWPKYCYESRSHITGYMPVTSAKQ